MWARSTAPVQTGPGTDPGLLYNGYLVFRGGKQRPERDADPSTLIVLWSRKSRAVPLFPYGPYGLYRTSVPVQTCTLTLPTELKAAKLIDFARGMQCIAFLFLIQKFHASDFNGETDETG